MKKPTDFLKMMGLEKRIHSFEPYGITCTKFKAGLMPCMNRHNEIEIIYSLGGSVTYFFQNRTVVVPPNCIALFWGMFPHQVVGVEGADYFYMSTIPLSLFIGMGLPDSFTNRVFGGEILMDKDSSNYANYDLLLFEHWSKDLEKEQFDLRVMLLEIHARFLRMSDSLLPSSVYSQFMQPKEVSLVEKMTLYIAVNYHRPIKVADIGRAVSLHPDYANTLFKRVFGHTLSYHLMLERITQSQRLLLTTSDTVVQIAEVCGFNSLSSFNSAFLKFNGCTPRDYRKHFQ